MKPTVVLHKKNITIFSLYIAFFAIYTFFLPITSKETTWYYISFTVSFIFLIGFMLYGKKNPRTVQFIILFGINLTTLLYSIIDFQLSDLLLFVFLLIITGIYQSFLISFGIIVISMLEVIFLLYILFPAPENTPSIPYLTISIIIIAILSIIGLVQTLYISKIWRKMERIATSKEKEILSREAYLRLFFQSAQDGIAVIDLNNRVIDMNPAFEKLYGWSREESIGKTISFIPPENTEAAFERFQQLLKGKSYHLFETIDMKKDGSRFNAQLSLSPVYDANGELLATSVISRDVSYKKENEKLIIQSEKLKLAGEIAAGVAHEIRNPMTVISGFVQMIENDKDSPYYPYMKIIQSEIDRINLIIGEFLVLSKPQAEELKPFLIDTVIEETYKLFQLEFQKHKIQFVQNWTANHLHIIGLENQLKQVFINIFKNALEAVEETELQRKIDLRVDKISESSFQISVTDNGIGMDDTQLEHIFEPFYTTKQKGTGLGMMITNKIIREHGGTISISSTKNKGTTITIQLPLSH